MATFTHLDRFSSQPRNAHHRDQRRLLLLLVAEADEPVALAEPGPVQDDWKAKGKTASAKDAWTRSQNLPANCQRSRGPN